MANIPVVTFISRITARIGQGYVYGTYFSALITEAIIQAKARQYPSQYTEDYIERSRAWIGEYAGDCVGLIKAAYWDDGTGTVTYRYLSRADTSANGMYNLATVKGLIASMPDEPGLFVHKDGHIGIYVGDNTVVESRGVDYGVVETAHVPGGTNSRGWLHWGRVPYVDYSAAPPEPDPEGTPVDYTGNLVPEKLEHGEYIKISRTAVSDLDALALVVGITNDAAGTPKYGGMYSGTFCGISYLCFFGANMVADFVDWAEDMDAGSQGDAIKVLFMLPENALPAGSVSGEYVDTDGVFGISNSVDVNYNQSTVDGYTPKNKKVFTYPYNFLHCTNLAGQSADYRFEFLDNNDGTMHFNYVTNIAPAAKTMIFPVGYKSRSVFAGSENVEEGLTLSEYPLCSWRQGAWENWIGQNKIAVVAGLAGSAASLISGAVSQSGSGIAGGIAGVAGVMGEIDRHMIEPDQARGNLHGASVNIAMTRQHFEFFQMQITAQYAERIDKFFEMFGYAQNKVKIPNIDSRPYWNYIKTIDCNITGDIPSDDMLELKNIFNNGVTIWHSITTVADYSQNNHETEVA